jgi:hypothetical protein
VFRAGTLEKEGGFMRHQSSLWLGFACAGLALLSAGPVSADITIVGHYSFVNGDTTTRSSYFTSRRVRVSTPDGREVIFDSKGRHITLIDHRRRVFWDGPLARADSIVDFADGSRWDFMLRNATTELKAEWTQAMDFPPDSIQTDDGFKTRMVAGYPCNRWTVRAGSYMTLERWTAASLAIDTYDETTADVVLAAVVDPIARAVMSMFWKVQDTTGLCLAASMTFSTPTQQGRFNWEAVKVIGTRIPSSAWEVPRDYGRAKLASEIPPAR